MQPKQYPEEALMMIGEKLIATVSARSDMYHKQSKGAVHIHVHIEVHTYTYRGTYI